QHQLDELRVSAGGARGLVEKLELATRPPVDLDALAEGNDPAAVLARWIREVESGGAQELVGAARRAMHAIHGARAYASIAGDAAPGDEDARAMLQRQAWALLDALLAQKEAAS